MYHGEDVLMVIEQGAAEARYFSRNLMCPSSGISYPNPEPNNFSFNSPKGACSKCNGIGNVHEVNIKKIIPDNSKSIKSGGLAPQGPQKNNWIFKQLELIAQRYNFKLSDPIKDIPKEAMEVILHGGNEKFNITRKTLGVTRQYIIDFEGIATFIESTYKNNDSTSLRRWAKDFMDNIPCPHCEGSRLRKESLNFKVAEKNIAQLANMDIVELAAWFKDLPNHLTKKQQQISGEILKEINARLPIWR